MKTVALLFCLTLYALPAFAGGVEEKSLYPFVESFQWREYKDDGTRILRESGPLFGVGGNLLVGLWDPRLHLKLKGEVFGSVVDYRGQTQFNANDPALSELPVDTDVEYLGTRLVGDLGWRFPLSSFSLQPFLGVGWNWWLRALQDSTALTPQEEVVPVSGYTESWHSVYSRFGLKGEYRHSEKLNFFAEVAAKYPFYVSNSIDFTGVGWVTFRPRGEWTPSAEVGASYRRLGLVLYYDGFKVSPSPIVMVEDTLFLQPRSHSDIFGLRISWSF